MGLGDSVETPTSFDSKFHFLGEILDTLYIVYPKYSHTLLTVNVSKIAG